MNKQLLSLALLAVPIAYAMDDLGEDAFYGMIENATPAAADAVAAAAAQAAPVVNSWVDKAYNIGGAAYRMGASAAGRVAGSSYAQATSKYAAEKAGYVAEGLSDLASRVGPASAPAAVAAAGLVTATLLGTLLYRAVFPTKAAAEEAIRASDLSEGEKATAIKLLHNPITQTTAALIAKAVPPAPDRPTSGPYARKKRGEVPPAPAARPGTGKYATENVRIMDPLSRLH